MTELDQCKKGFKTSPFKKGTRSHTDNNYNRPSSTNINDVKSIENSSGWWNNISKDVKCRDVMDLTYTKISHTILTKRWHP